MWYIGIDLHGKYMTISGVKSNNKIVGKHIKNQDLPGILKFFKDLGRFKAVIEACGTYIWLYDLLISLGGEVVIAHPLKLKAIGSAKVKTDKIDSLKLAIMLEGNLIPESYVPDRKYNELREITRYRCRLIRDRTTVKNRINFLLRKRNIENPYKTNFSKRAVNWMKELELPEWDQYQKEQLLDTYENLQEKIQDIRRVMDGFTDRYPEVEAIMDIPGIGIYTALVIVAEIADPRRFPNADKVASYSGLCSRVNQSGSHCYYGHITREGSAWLRWVLVDAAMKAARTDPFLRNFYQRIRKRRGKMIARVAAARKLIRICWRRLLEYEKQNMELKATA